MKLVSWLPASAALAAPVLALTILTGAGTAAASGAARGVATTSATVVQTGKRNYAGPRCPGKSWTCTTATRVLQSGDDNRFECEPRISVVSKSNSGGSQSCVIMQNNPNGRNSARCVENARSATTVQVCTITQTGISNNAVVEQVATSGGPTQSASQTATVTQNGATAKNQLRLRQHVNHTPGSKGDDDDDDDDDERATSAPPGGTVKQDAWQRADVVQVASGAGSNSAMLRQDERQHAVGGATQLQNTDPSLLGDCYAVTSGPTSPNVCANVSQTAASGDNQTDLNQGINQRARTKAVATQQQGSFAGGVDGRVHQETGAAGRNFNQANQTKIQRMFGAPGSAQSQFDPLRCCGVGSQVGGSNNRESIDQRSSQDASEADAFQESSLAGESLTPQGACSIKQHASNNSDSATNSFAVEPCPYVLLATTCTSGSGERVDQQQVTGECTAFEPILTPPELGVTDQPPSLPMLARLQG
jgi:hypothetical protein